MKKCLIIGGGAAGLMCAARLAESHSANLEISIIEHKDNIGYKLLATGNGRCNLTNILDCRNFCEYGFVGEQGRFVRGAIYDFPPVEQLEFFSAHGVEAELVDGFHYFPKSQKSADVLNVFRNILAQKNVQVLYNKEISRICVENGFVKGVILDNQELKCNFLVVACGGMSYPATGSNGTIFPVLEELGIEIKERVPALVGLQIAEQEVTFLAGNVLKNAEVSVKIGKNRIYHSGELLFTQTGVSGPAILDLSGSVARLLKNGAETVEIAVNLNAEYDSNFWHDFLTQKRQSAGKKNLRNLLHEFFFLNLVDFILKKSGISLDRKIAELSRKEEEKIIENLIALKLNVVDTDGFKKAIATSGGVELKEIDRQTLEAKKNQNLFFAGEVLDVDGRCGGYNLTWAFASGARVAQIIEERLKN